MNPLAIDTAALDRELVRRRGFYEFVKRAWHVVEPGVAFVDNWHIREICNACQAVTEGKVTDLVINVPPGMSKSTIVSILWPAWAWTVNPKLRWIFASFDYTLSLSHATKMFDLIRSQWYCARWGMLLPEQGHFAMAMIETRQGGFRFSTSVGGKGTGRHAHIRVVDDPNKPADAMAGARVLSARLERTSQWWKGTMASRRVDPKNFASVVIMQRLHESDLAGECIAEGYYHLCLPMYYDPRHPYQYALDPRTEPGELLAPDRFDAGSVASMVTAMGGLDSDVCSAQLQQLPAPPGGLMFKEESFQSFTLAQMPFDRCHATCLSIDCTFKDQAHNDFVCFEVWGLFGTGMYCYESILLHLDLAGTIGRAKSVLEQYHCGAVLVEDKANGTEVIKALRRAMPNVIAMNPKTSKEARAQAANIYYQARSVYHLDAPWRPGKETHLKQFPKGAVKDDVDATSQALIHLADNNTAMFERAMANVHKEISEWHNLKTHFSAR